MSDDLHFCTFTVDGLYLGIPVRQVQEVIRSLDMTSVPLAPHAVHGLINLRGQIITAIDLRRRLGLSDREAESEPMHVVVRTDDGAVSFLVDEIGDVIEAAPNSFERAPAMLHEDARVLVAGVHKLADRLLLVLDTTRAVNFEFAAV
jgi:purine-binding chemotaxis protein CheW